MSPTTQSNNPPVVVDWHLPQVIRPYDYPDYDYALVILNQPIDNEPLFDELWSRGELLLNPLRQARRPQLRYYLCHLSCA